MDDETYRLLFGVWNFFSVTGANSRTTDQANRLTWVAHNLELRCGSSGQHSANGLCFSITGRGEELDAPLPR